MNDSKIDCLFLLVMLLVVMIVGLSGYGQLVKRITALEKELATMKAK